MKKLLACFVLLVVVVFPISAYADLERVCSRGRNRVNLRTGPGRSYPQGLVEVGSGGVAVDNYFRQRNYTISNGEQVSIFDNTRGTDGYTWYKVGTNQWVAWVRSDFVCRM